jgi:hypothetical protein
LLFAGDALLGLVLLPWAVVLMVRRHTSRWFGLSLALSCLPDALLLWLFRAMQQGTHTPDPTIYGVLGLVAFKGLLLTGVRLRHRSSA